MKKQFFLAFISIFLFVGCQFNSTGQYICQPPENINDGIEIGTLNEVDIDSTLIIKGINKINKGRFKEIHSLLIFKDNKLVLEEYFSGHKYQWDGPNHHAEWVKWEKDISHHLMSVTKSFTSACVGIAIDKGYIKNVDESIFNYLPEYIHLNKNGKEKITIEHLLTMTSALGGDEWNAPYSSTKNPIIALWVPPCEDPTACILENQLEHEPGTHFAYFGGHQILLGKIIENATGMKIDSFSQEYLFDPLGINSAEWAVRFDNGVIEAAGGLKMTPRDMMRFGVAFLNNGKWNGENIISEKWVEKSATPYKNNTGIKVPGVDVGRAGYSYSWWTKEYDENNQKINLFYAGGWGGQKIMILPEINTVVVVTGGTYTSKTKVFTLFEKYILPAII